MLVQLKPSPQLTKEIKLTPMIQLDALRAIAVFGVLVSHWLPKYFFLNYNVASGQFAVRLFFVLSSFLITSLLLEYRSKINDNRSNFWSIVRRFYMRRCLRLFPIYYLTIFLTAIFYLRLHPSLIWHLTYTSNFYYSTNAWDINSSFWSLAVEFQFYLVWPFIILLTPQKHTEKLIIATILVGPIFRILGVAMGLSEEIKFQLLIPGCLDCLGLGALLAFYNSNRDKSEKKKLLCNCGFWIGGTLSFALIIVRPYLDMEVRLVISDIINGLFLVWVVAQAARGFSDIAGTILEFKPLVYLGKISYGIYIYHSFVAAVIVPNSLHYLGFTYPISTRIVFAINTIITIIVAMISWHYIEQPCNNLKRKFKI